MDTDTAPPSPGLPRNASFETTTYASSATPQEAVAAGTVLDRGERGNAVFGHLVQEDGDIAGLVAYSIYKQNKLDWLRAFESAKGRAPDDNELASYIIGEGTPRRLATYRHLAEATLAGNGPEVDGTPPPAARPLRAGRRIGRTEGISAAAIALYAIVAVLFVVGFYFALHFTATTR